MRLEGLGGVVPERGVDIFDLVFGFGRLRVCGCHAEGGGGSGNDGMRAREREGRSEEIHCVCEGRHEWEIGIDVGLNGWIIMPGL